MPLFGKKKSPEEQIAATRAKLRDLVQQCLAGNIQRTELPERFYTLMKNEFPLRYLAEPAVNHYMSDTSDLPLEARMIYGATMLPTLQRLLAEAQGR